MQEGVLQLHTDYDTDQQAHEKASYLNANKHKYQGKSFNCATYVSEVLHKTVFKKKLGKENIFTFLIRSITPNKLWKDITKKVDNGDISGTILVDPGSNIDNSFRGGLKGEKEK
ncbi:hypothetical protein JGH11_04810 [Dysgonomonas sp. Marseille-P4677]|uniref:hypothetical protein n=1 Tax=Dysgonomonas sp. Marseille-P4677 TaxID=2364790 RepID=UPI001911968F|nr:hypothetical protein [Dysgonomonas sp. Marseille-P4677]MBK5720187.1 hypothetical protein [Dysgonomonas sp. Marseille-P4677]